MFCSHSLIKHEDSLTFARMSNKVSRRAGKAQKRPAPRLPTQERAIHTVDAIVDATRVLLVRHGLEGLSTNAIAKRAGVSIGSLYQYFAGRDAIVAELIRRHVQQATALIIAATQELLHEDLEVGLRRLIRMMVDVHRQDPEFYSIIESMRPVLVARPARVGQGAPPSLRKAAVTSVHERVMEMAVAYLSRHREALVVDDLERAAFVAVTTIDGLIHQSLMSWPELLDDDGIVDDATRLVFGYLTSRVPGRHGRAASGS